MKSKFTFNTNKSLFPLIIIVHQAVVLAKHRHMQPKSSTQKQWSFIVQAAAHFQGYEIIRRACRNEGGEPLRLNLFLCLTRVLTRLET